MRRLLLAVLALMALALSGCGGGSSGNTTPVKSTPTITWPTPAAITYGTALSATQLDATASVAGTFTYSPAAGTVLTAGSQTLSVTFTPTDTTDYNTATASVTLIVNKATPTVTWDPPVPVQYGNWLGNTTLSAIANVPGSFTYSPAAGTQLLTLGTVSLSLAFTPTDATDYNSVTATNTLTVTQGIPALSWTAPAPVVQGAALSSTQLNATALYGVTGTFSYSPDVNTVMNTPGTTILTATFTPTDTTDYTTASTTTALTVVPSTGTALIDFGAAEQTIDGFGGSEAWSGPMASATINDLYGTAAGDLALTIMRVRIAPATWTSSTQTADTTQWTTELENASAAQALGATIFASPWTPPPSMKIDNASRASGVDSGILNPSSYSDYANYLKAYVAYASSLGVNLYAISMQNEPDWDPMTYESCLWTASQMDSWAAAYGSVPTAGTNVQLMMPESFSFSPAMSATALNDPTAEPKIGIIAGHLYGGPPTYPTLAKSMNKEVWETEHYLNSVNSSSTATSWSTSIGDALAVAEEIHTAMTLGEYNAYNWWWLVNSNDNQPTGLIDSSNNPTYFGLGMEHFSRFVRPGYVRYSATSNPVSGVYLSAYAGNGHQVIVVTNANTTAVSLPIQINNQTITSLTPYQTTSGASVAAQAAIAVTGNSFTASLPAQSVTTYVQ
jgi:glucuronoarabinoxylan endo-1,4-beta-xylanase